ANVADAPVHLWWVPTSILSLALVALLFFVLGRDDDDAQRCDDGAALLAGVWDAEVRKSFEDRVLASGLPYAEPVWQGFAADLDGWSQRWRQTRLEICETRAADGQYADMAARRLSCLDRQLVRFSSVLTGLRENQGESQVGDPSAAEEWLGRMTELEGRLPEPERCDAVTILARREHMPEDREQAAVVERLRTRLAEVDGLSDAASYAAAVELGEGVLSEARELGFDALTAEALASLGAALNEQDHEPERAAALLYEGALLAQASGNDATLVRVAGKLIDNLAQAQAKHELAELWGAIAEATLTRVGDDPSLEIDLRLHLGDLAMAKGDFAGALAAHERARDLIGEQHGEHHPIYLRALRSVGDDLRELGRSDESAELLERVRLEVTAAYGRNHPEVSATLNALANVRADQRRFEEAIDCANEAVSISESLHGPEHHTVANILNNLAIIYDQMGRYDEAVTTLERAHHLQVLRFGPDHPNVAIVSVNLGSALQNLARFDEAIAQYQSALVVLQDSVGPGHMAAGVALQNIASAMTERGRLTGDRADFEGALAEFDASEAVLVAAVGREHPSVASLEQNRAQALRGLDRLDEALVAANRAVTTYETLFGSEHAQLVGSLAVLSNIELALGHPHRALELAQRATRLAGEGNAPRERAEATLALVMAMVADPEADAITQAQARELARAA
ncbi:MAG: tetratricopeptide repeat protein, partial [Myxococcales bacterium]|nr:tetratricopeptide repeat protein [Myxococcales bacterium]